MSGQVSRVIPISAIEMLTGRLTAVRKYGDGYRAKCPAHDGQSTTSLSFCVGDDGRVLIHCFGGCSTHDVLSAVGMKMADLFERRLVHQATPAQRRELKSRAREARWMAALSAMELEAAVIEVACRQALSGEPLTHEDLARIKLARERIRGAVKELHHD